MTEPADAGWWVMGAQQIYEVFQRVKAKGKMMDRRLSKVSVIAPLVVLLLMSVVAAPAWAVNFALSENYADSSKYPGVTTDAYDAAGLSSYLVDSNSATSWQISGIPAPTWVMIDLGQVRDIGGIALLCDDIGSTGPQAASIEVGGPGADPYQGMDGPDWTVVGSVANPNGTTGSRMFRFPTVQAQRVRIYITEVDLFTYAATIFEVAVMSGAATSHSAASGSANVPWLAIDGDAGTYSLTSNSQSSSWQVVDIGQDDVIREVTQVKLDFAAGQPPPAAFRIQHGFKSANPYAPETDPSWTDAVSYSTNNQSSLTVDLSPGVRRAKWRVFTGTYGQALPIAELQLNGQYGPALGDVTGTVTNVNNGELVVGATVTADSGETTTTNELGVYSLHLSGESHVLTVSKTEYTTASKTVAVQPNSSVVQDFQIDGPYNLAMSTDWARQFGVNCIASHNGSSAPLETGTITSYDPGTSTNFPSIRDASKAWATDQWKFHVVRMTSGQNAGRDYLIGPDGSNTSSRIRFYFEQYWLDGVKVGDTFEIRSPAQGLVNDHVAYAEWQAQTAANGWVMVDLGQERTIGGIGNVTYDVWGRGPVKFKFQVGDAAADPAAPETDPAWKTVVDCPAWNRNTNVFAQSFEPVKGQRVRYLYDHTGDQWMRMQNFSVFSGASVALQSPGYLGNSFIGSVYSNNAPYTMWAAHWCAIDGTTNTFACPSTGIMADPWRLPRYIVDLGPGSNTLRIEIQAATFGAVPWWGNLRDLDVQYSTKEFPDILNDADWTTLYHYVGHADSPADLFLSVDVPSELSKVRRWRLFRKSMFEDELLDSQPLALEEIRFIGRREVSYAQVASIAAAKDKADGANVEIAAPQVVTAAFGDRFYIEDPARASGIKVASSAAVTVGSSVTVKGKLETVNGERQLTASAAPAVVGSATVEDLGVRNWAVGGASVGRIGVGTVGLLVRVWGKVVDNSQTGFIVLDDGSGYNVKVDISRVTGKPAVGQGVWVIGVCSAEKPAADVVPLVIARSNADKSW